MLRRTELLRLARTGAEARLAEAKDRAWLGEVAALEESLKHLRQRRAEAESRSQGLAGLSQ